MQAPLHDCGGLQCCLAWDGVVYIFQDDRSGFFATAMTPTPLVIVQAGYQVAALAINIEGPPLYTCIICGLLLTNIHIENTHDIEKSYCNITKTYEILVLMVFQGGKSS